MSNLEGLLLRLPAWVDAELEWMNQGACRSFADDTCFPPHYRCRDFRCETCAEVKRVKSICGRCPVKDVCLDYALEIGEQHGIWGGMTPVERAAEKRRRVHDSQTGQTMLWEAV